jgi:hypothetical protein
LSERIKGTEVADSSVMQRENFREDRSHQAKTKSAKREIDRVAALILAHASERGECISHLRSALSGDGMRLYLNRSRTPEHAASEADRLLARPTEFEATAIARSGFRLTHLDLQARQSRMI